MTGEGEMKGMELELILMMAKELDYKVTFIPMEFSGILAAVEGGKADICCGSLIITPERSEVVNFIHHHKTAFILIVRSAAAPENAGLFESLSESFRISPINRCFSSGMMSIFKSLKKLELIVPNAMVPLTFW